MLAIIASLQKIATMASSYNIDLSLRSFEFLWSSTSVYASSSCDLIAGSSEYLKNVPMILDFGFRQNDERHFKIQRRFVGKADVNNFKQIELIFSKVDMP